MFDFDEQRLLQQYQQLFQTPQNFCTKAFVNKCLAVAKQLLESAQQQPQLALALLTSRQVESSPVPECLRGALFLSVATRRNNFNDHFAQHLIASFLCTFVVMYAKEKNNDTVELKPLVNFCQSLGLSIWKETLRIAILLTRRQAFRHISSPKLSFRQQYLLAACVVARQLPQKEMLAIFRILTDSASPALQDVIGEWAQFPGVWLPGRVINVGESTAVILAREKRKLAFLPLPVSTQVIKWASVNEVSLLRSPQTVDFKKIKQWTDNVGLNAHSTNWPYSPSFALNRPPAKLLKIIDLLNGSQTDISLLCEQIKQEPLLAQFLKSAATHDNRMNLPVNDVKQAVLTYGIERVGDMLVQQALNQRLNQKQFPISALCQRLLSLSSNIAAHLCYESDSPITPQNASLLMTFALAPIFSIPAFKIALNWRPAATLLFSVDSLVPSTNESIRHQAVQLMNGWHQSVNLQMAVKSSNRLPDQCHPKIRYAVCIMGLSLSLARQWLWNPSHFCEVTEDFDYQAKRLLGVDGALLSKLQEQLTQQIWLPINR
ncbi:HDOD domain-containing protein [Alteromonas ponticola]|uniref:HDOD domain-containing protein n=1 Tax=Alteromonas ponticola TaxID=2720613 RepID=A0ABX1QZS8_9ALTE|nr:HDOD domain-containing protein [Alteromonas ponticola]NMH59733.1 HDOD domain-containing protein [Alteromonas ponticola]